jgi:hypothetical protein
MVVEPIEMDETGTVDVDGHLFSADEATRLRTAVENSYRNMEPHRRNAKERIEEMCGYHYSDNKKRTKRNPINLIELAVTTHKRALVSRAPKPDVTTEHWELKPLADDLELAIKQVLDENQFDELAQECVVDALFLLGVVKCALTRTREIQIEDERYTDGDVFIDKIQFDDVVVDMTATSWRDLGFIGNYYRPTVDEVVEAGLMTEEEAREHILLRRERVDAKDDDGPQDIGAPMQAWDEDYVDRIALLDLFLPHRNILVTMLANGSSMPLRASVWRGPTTGHGPYFVLGFVDIPSNLMFLPPSANWMDLHQLANTLMRKLQRQAEAEKTVYGALSGHEGEAKMIMDAEDQAVVSTSVIPQEAVFPYQMGGVNGKTLALTLAVKDLFSYIAGNLDSIAGLGPSADTLGQEKIIQDASSQRILDMRQRVARFGKKIATAVAWYVWTDPYREYSVVKRVEGIPQLAIPSLFTPESRTGDFLSFNVNINLASVVEPSPGERLEFLRRMVMEIVAPMLPIIMQQGYYFDMIEFLNQCSDLSSVVELKNVIKPMGVPPAQQPAIVEGTPKANVTNRTYTRKNVSNPKSAQNEMMMSLMNEGGSNGR